MPKRRLEPDVDGDEEAAVKYKRLANDPTVSTPSYSAVVDTRHVCNLFFSCYH